LSNRLICSMPGIVTVQPEQDVTPSKKMKKVKKVKVAEEVDSGLVEDLTPEIKVKKVKKVKKETENGTDEGTIVKKTKKRKQEDPDTPKKKKSKKIDSDAEIGDDVVDEGEKVSSGSDSPVPEPKMEFEKEWLQISEVTRKKLQARGVIQLFPVQAKTYNQVFEGNDVIVQSRTGSGKTFAFAIPIVEKLQGDQEQTRKRGRYPRALVMAPTRELASQICRDIESIATGLSATAIYGGVSYEKQENMLRKGTDVVVGTPGRIKDMMNKGTLNFSELQIVTLDEVDRMLDMGFADAVDECIGACYEMSRPQTLFFSATCPSWVMDTAVKYMEKVPPVINMVGKNENRTSKTVRHLAIKCGYHDWADVIGDLITAYCGKSGRAIIFASTKKDCSDLALSDQISDAQMIHGDIEQKTREQTLQAFRDGKMRVLVGTDVAARGLDIPEVDLVIQTEPPSDIDSYIHRSGRTGRAGRSGICICLYKPQAFYNLQKVEHVAGFKFEQRGPVSGVELEEAAARDVKLQIAKLPEKSGARFIEVAREMIAAAEEDGSSAESLLASAIAIMSGVTDCSSRSMLNGKKGSQTWRMDVKFELRSSGFIFALLEKSISAEARAACKGMRLLSDNLGGVFDLPSSMTEEVEKKWGDTETLTLAKCDILPEMAPMKFDSSGGGGSDRRYGGGGGRGRSFGGGRGGGGRGGGRGRGGGGGSWQRKKY